ncbi:MAG: replication factor C large subunit [Methanoregulaceae archaeon]|nr:replication factor C large subunit [Methanoregulaceae archaeon]
MDWAEKYRPQHLKEVVGNSPALREMLDWARSWTPGSKPLILYGKPGTGKTSSAYALAHDMNWEVIELNASDQRTKGLIDRVAGNASTSGTLTGSQRRLILLDEADNLQGTADRGGARAILDIIRTSQQPIIMVANDLYGLPPELRSRGNLVQFKALQARSIAPHLKFICTSEKMTCSDTALRVIAERANGDMRAAVNMLYASASGKRNITEDDVHTSEKDVRSTIFSLLTTLFSKNSDEELFRKSYELDDTPDAIEQWIEANVHAINDQGRIADAYRCLSRADEYIGNTFRAQYYTLWRYATAVMLLGVSSAAGGHGIHERITSPGRWRKMAAMRQQRGTRIGLMSKLATALHISQQTLRGSTYMQLITMLIDVDPLSYARELSLDADQLEMVLHDPGRVRAVMKELEQERKEVEKLEKAKETAKRRAEKERKAVMDASVAKRSPAIEEKPAAEEDTVPEKKRSHTQATLF